MLRDILQGLNIKSLVKREITSCFSLQKLLSFYERFYKPIFQQRHNFTALTAKIHTDPRLKILTILVHAKSVAVVEGLVTCGPTLHWQR